MELGSAGRERAVWLRDKAQAWLEASWNSQWIDMTLAKAALVSMLPASLLNRCLRSIQIIAVYESSAHPLYTPERARRSLAYLDGIVRQLGLTFLDGNEPDVSTFTPNAVPIAHRHRPFDQMSKDGVRTPHAIPRKCDCIPLPNSSIATEQFSSSWSFTPPWDPSWTPEEMHKESCRRLCWSALNLVARYTSHCIAFQKEPSDLFLTDPSNVCFFSAHLTRADSCTSFGYCFLVRYHNEAPMSTRRSPRKNQYGHSIAAACSFGISAPLVSGKMFLTAQRQPTLRLKLGRKPLKSRMPWIPTPATSIWRCCTCVGSTCTSTPISYPWCFSLMAITFCSTQIIITQILRA